MVKNTILNQLVFVLRDLISFDFNVVTPLLPLVRPSLPGYSSSTGQKEGRLHCLLFLANLNSFLIMMCHIKKSIFLRLKF